jgi:hypothetical protein
VSQNDINLYSFVVEMKYFFLVKQELLIFFKIIYVTSCLINTILFPNNLIIGCNAATCFGSKLRNTQGATSVEAVLVGL